MGTVGGGSRCAGCVTHTHTPRRPDTGDVVEGGCHNPRTPLGNKEQHTRAGIMAFSPSPSPVNAMEMGAETVIPPSPEAMVDATSEIPTKELGEPEST